MPTIAAPITPKQLATLVGLSVDKVRCKIRRGLIAVFPLGPPYLIPPDEANRLLTPVKNERPKNDRVAAARRRVIRNARSRSDGNG